MLSSVMITIQIQMKDHKDNQSHRIIYIYCIKWISITNQSGKEGGGGGNFVKTFTKCHTQV